MNNRRSFITGIKSTTLSIKEKKFLHQYKPWGVILFSRNIESLKQAKKLTDQIKKILKDKNYPILIDQEGGRVNRLKKIFNTDSLTGELFGELYLKDKKKFYTFYNIFIDQTSFSDELQKGEVYFLGDGAHKCKETINHKNAIFIDDKFPSSREMATLSYDKYKKGDIENVAYFEPFYLKDFIVIPEKKKKSHKS